MRRVVITGMGIVSPLGSELPLVARSVSEGRHGIRTMHEWDSVTHLRSKLGAPAFAKELDEIPRKTSRSMGRLSMLAAVATTQAIRAAGLSNDDLGSPRLGLAYGSTHGSSQANEDWVRKLIGQGGFLGLSALSYLKFMSHTAASSLAIHFGIRGRVMTTCAACVSASQAVGYAYEAIKHGECDVMLAGGAEELHFTLAGVFDVMFAASHRFNDAPDSAPRPFDKDRDGLVVGEGAATFVLEDYDRARARGRNIYAEVLGFGTNCDGTHVTNPSRDGMAGAMRLALENARMVPSDIGYVNAHATATEVGDIVESQATFDLFGDKVPVSSLKGHFGHTLGACGTLEAATCLEMIRSGLLPATRNLDSPDPRCAPLDYVRGAARRTTTDVFMSNKFAFGGINTSLIFRLL